MIEKSTEFHKEEKILDQNLIEKLVESGNPQDKTINSSLNHSLNYALPSIKKRYISILIDGMVIIVLSIGISTIFEKIGSANDYLRALTFLIVVILYEPILVSTGCTVGQFLTNIRVRLHNNPVRKIWFPSAFLRVIIKVCLGWVSLITITFDLNRRAIHDYLSGSIMINKESK